MTCYWSFLTPKTKKKSTRIHRKKANDHLLIIPQPQKTPFKFVLEKESKLEKGSQLNDLLLIISSNHIPLWIIQTIISPVSSEVVNCVCVFERKRERERARARASERERESEWVRERECERERERESAREREKGREREREGVDPVSSEVVNCVCACVCVCVCACACVMSPGFGAFYTHHSKQHTQP
jgi:hypothetical protein